MDKVTGQCRQTTAFFLLFLWKTFVVAVAFLRPHVLSCRAWRAFHFFTKKPSRECIILLKGITYVTDPLGPEWGSRTGLRLRSGAAADAAALEEGAEEGRS